MKTPDLLAEADAATAAGALAFWWQEAMRLLASIVTARTVHTALRFRRNLHAASTMGNHRTSRAPRGSATSSGGASAEGRFRLAVRTPIRLRRVADARDPPAPSAVPPAFILAVRLHVHARACAQERIVPSCPSVSSDHQTWMHIFREYAGGSVLGTARGASSIGWHQARHSTSGHHVVFNTRNSREHSPRRVTCNCTPILHLVRAPVPSPNCSTSRAASLVP